MTKVINQMTGSQVQSLFEYRSGKLFWRQDKGTAKAGDRIGCRCKDGTRRVGVQRTGYLEHVLIWNLFNGSIPEGEVVEHVVQGKGSRIDNLRLIPWDRECRKRGVRADNSSGHSGVEWFPSSKRWRVKIGVGKKHRTVGFFKDLDEAVQARKDAERKYWIGGNQFQEQVLNGRNTSGVTGVSWEKGRGRWSANIRVKGKNIYLGRFIEKDSAVQARKDAEIKYDGEQGDSQGGMEGRRGTGGVRRNDEGGGAGEGTVGDDDHGKL